ncbi:hypothetical protein B0H21DRAFT_748489 [Amylocystis lapponica]|nr:hypothetical protein B0H21DRAFT_748489 [Amylocystis lapponica]
MRIQLALPLHTATSLSLVTHSELSLLNHSTQTSMDSFENNLQFVLETSTRRTFDDVHTPTEPTPDVPTNFDTRPNGYPGYCVIA